MTTIETSARNHPEHHHSLLDATLGGAKWTVPFAAILALAGCQKSIDATHLLDKGSVSESVVQKLSTPEKLEALLRGQNDVSYPTRTGEVLLLRNDREITVTSISRGSCIFYDKDTYDLRGNYIKTRSAQIDPSTFDLGEEQWRYIPNSLSLSAAHEGINYETNDAPYIALDWLLTGKVQTGTDASIY